jgi:hypothetical protein
VFRFPYSPAARWWPAGALGTTPDPRAPFFFFLLRAACRDRAARGRRAAPSSRSPLQPTATQPLYKPQAGIKYKNCQLGFDGGQRQPRHLKAPNYQVDRQKRHTQSTLSGFIKRLISSSVNMLLLPRRSQFLAADLALLANAAHTFALEGMSELPIRWRNTPELRSEDTSDICASVRVHELEASQYQPDEPPVLVRRTTSHVTSSPSCSLDNLP